jgi:hypothetical protein
MKKTSTVRYLILIIVSFSLFFQGCDKVGSQKVNFKTEYQAIFLLNGQVYFGKAELGPDYITLRDVYYIQSHVGSETKEVANILVKRGKEWHSPDVMYISTHAITLIEPVAANSQVAKLIKESAGAGATK